MMFIEYEVIEHYQDAAPEPFGHYLHPAGPQPKAGDSIMLKWLDGRDAYRVTVDRVVGVTLHVSSAGR